MLNTFLISLVMLYLYLKCIKNEQKPAYAYCSALQQKWDENAFVGTCLSFFRTNESYSNKKELKKLIGKEASLRNEKMLVNADKQEELNNSKRVRKIKKMQRIRELKKNFKNALKAYKPRDFVTLFIYIALPFVFLALLKNPKLYDCFEKFGYVVKEHRVDIYLSQLSLTFITISLMSIFSDSNAIILWENIVKKTLIEPPASCFKAYFSYSFIYLFFGTLSFVLGYDEGITVFFVFNILCLFDLSRTMINCYYDPSRKRKKIIKDFIKKIEEANIVVLKKGPGIESDEYVSAIKSTFEDFNYYINESFNKDKISDIKEDLAVYGKLFAHVDNVILSVEEINVLQWYCKKTIKSYIALVKSYYEECGAILTGVSNTNSQQVSASLSNIHRNIIGKLLVMLAKDSGNIYLNDELYNLILTAFHINILSVARDEDADNMDKYILDNTNGVKRSILEYKEKRLQEMLKRLSSVIKKEEKNTFGMGSWLHWAIVRAVGNVVLINTDDLCILDMKFLCWNEIEDKEKIIEELSEYVEENIKDFSEERKEKCIKRKDKVIKALTEKS